ncbi:flavodoxin reductase [Roseibium sp.]|uniref:flavodoxin reductase n=1 Tax=Roseibium sp. TaxID=1936156 RepID=UPI003A96A5E4
MQKSKILVIEPVTHDVKRIRLSRPDGFDYQVGDATELALDIDDWRDEKRPFTMTSLPDDPFLEFTIKEYPDHDGVTTRLHDLKAGETILIDEPFKTFRNEGKGLFIAGGAGITPFLAILRAQREKHSLDGYTLIFANKRTEDIICRDNLASMPELKVVHVLSDDDEPGMRHGKVDADLIRSEVDDLDQRFYLCGPPPMMEAVQASLDKLGVKADAIDLSD